MRVTRCRARYDSVARRPQHAREAVTRECVDDASLMPMPLRRERGAVDMHDDTLYAMAYEAALRLLRRLRLMRHCH